MITYHEEKERLNEEIRVKDISAERRSHLREELSNLLDVHDQIWYQKCLSDLQGINQALSGSAMQYTLPENFLTEASAADWRGYLESSEALLKSIDMQSQVAQPLDAIDDGGGDEEEEDENDNDENAAALIGDEGSPMPDVVPDEGSSRVTSDNSTRVCIVCFTGPKKDLSAGGMDGLQIQCVACDNFVHLSCQGKCPQCHETLCRICLDEHVNGSCPAGPGIFADTGGNAVSRLVPSNVENDGTVTSTFEIAAKHSFYKPEFFDDNGLAKALRPRLVDSGMLKTVLDTLNETELATVKEEVANHVEKSDTIMLCMICNQPKRITMCFDCGTAELCATCMFNHGCMEPLCGYCGSRNLDSLIDNSTCDACGRRDLCAGCLGAHCCEAVRDEVDEKHSDKRDHLVCLVPNPAERAAVKWELIDDDTTVEFPLCDRCGDTMMSDDTGNTLCKGCRLDPTEKATMTVVVQGIIRDLRDLDKTDLFRGEEHKTYCVCCCMFASDPTEEMFLCSSKERCQAPYKVCNKCVTFTKDGDKCHMCAGKRCPTRYELHVKDGVDDIVLKFFVLETASKLMRYLAQSQPSVDDHTRVIYDHAYDDCLRVRIDARRVFNYKLLLQHMKAKGQNKLLPRRTRMFFWHSRLETLYPFTEETFDEMVTSCVLPQGERANVHVYVLTPFDNIDMGANERAKLHNRKPTCQQCTCVLTDIDVDNGRVLCDRPGCASPDATYLWEVRSDGGNRSDDDVAAGGNAAATSPIGYPGDDADFEVDGDASSSESLTTPRVIAPATAASNERVRDAAAMVEARRRVEERLPAMRDSAVTPLNVDELRALTQGMSTEEMNAFADSRAIPKAMPKQRSAGRGTAQPGMKRMVGAYTEASATATQATPPKAAQGAPRSSTTAEGDQNTAAALAMIHGLASAMGTMSGENNPSDHTAAAIAKASPEAAALFSGNGRAERASRELNRMNDAIPLSTDRIAQLIHSDPRITRDRLVELGRMFPATPEGGAASAAPAAATNEQMSGERFALFLAYVRRNIDGRALDNEADMARLFPELFQDEVPDDVNPDDLSDGLPEDYGPGHED